MTAVQGYLLPVFGEAEDDVRRKWLATSKPPPGERAQRAGKLESGAVVAVKAEGPVAACVRGLREPPLADVFEGGHGEFQVLFRYSRQKRPPREVAVGSGSYLLGVT
jgi:hypothetical protein